MRVSSPPPPIRDRHRPPFHSVGNVRLGVVERPARAVAHLVLVAVRHHQEVAGRERRRSSPTRM